MLVYFFNGRIEAESVNRLISAITQSEEKVNVYFCSSGGDCSAGEALVEFLNFNTGKVILTLVNYCCSTAVDVFSNFKGKVKVHPSLYYVTIHKVDMPIQSERKDNFLDENKLLKYMREENKEYAKIMPSLGFTPKEIRTYTQGHDVIIYKEDFKRMKFNWEL